jgi:NAD(P)-dependent dehydrogenase (short-subunit alcohol dehydrogenase family)
LAGAAGAGPLAAVSLADWRRLIDVNLTSAFLLAKAAYASLAASQGSLTLTSSTNGLNGGSSLSGPAYAVAKAGLINLTRYLAKEWAPERIRVNCLAPGPIDTPMVTGRFSAQVLDQLRHNVPLGRLGAPQDVAHAIDYLTSPAAGFVTGTVMNLSGGMVLD